MKVRAITGFFFVLVMLGAMLLGATAFSLFFFALSLFSLDEYYRLVTQKGADPQRFSGIAAGASVFGVVVLQQLREPATVNYFLPVPFIVFMFLAELYRKRALPFDNLAHVFAGIIFTVVPFGFFYSSAFLGDAFNPHIPLAFFFMLWANDTGAYLSGMMLGRTKLFERHSPKKTWEGFVGGVIISIGVSFLISMFWTELSQVQWAGMALIIGVFGTLGDLTESMLKRSLDVKDSGSFLPGHGGLLDRFDGLFLSAPLVFIYLYMIFS